MPGTHSGRTVHINVPLSNVAINYRPEGLIADQIAPTIPVTKQSDGYYKFDQADIFRGEDDKRAPGTEARVMETRLSSETYFAPNYALKDNVPYEDIENADAKAIMFERTIRAERITDKLFLNWEIRVATKVTTAANVGSSSAVASAWTDFTNSTPITDVNTGLNNVEDATGYRPNRIVFSGEAWRNFRENSAVITRVFGTARSDDDARIVKIKHVEALFEVEQVLIAGAYKNGGAEGQALSLERIWGDHVLLHYTPMKPRKDKPAFMYSFRWNKVMTMQAKVYQLPRSSAEQVELGYYQDEKITGSALGFLVLNVTSSS